MYKNTSYINSKQDIYISATLDTNADLTSLNNDVHFHMFISSKSNFVNMTKLKAAKYAAEDFLKDYKNSQKGILKFINFCQNYEDQDGFLLEGFFKNIVISKAKFLNGPLANLVFDILENNNLLLA